MQRNAQLNRDVIFILCILGFLVSFLSFGISLKTLAFFFGLIFFFIAFIHTDFALFIILFSMLLSPEIAVGGVPGRSVVVRIDDILLLVILFGWLARIAVHKELTVLQFNPLNLPILAYVTVSAIASCIAVLAGNVTIKETFFYNAKYIEYFLLFFMVVNLIQTRKQAVRFIFIMLFVTLSISIYAWGLHFSGHARVTAPFEGKFGEPNTLGGYLLLLIMIAAGLLFSVKTLKARLFLFITLFFSLPAFLFTLSRGSWLGLIPAYIMLFVLSKRGKLIIFAVFVLLVIWCSFFLPGFVYERLLYTFSSHAERIVLGQIISTDKSLAARIDSWKENFERFSKSPLYGYGVGNPGPTVDNQYSRLLVETGLPGLLTFFWIIIIMFKQAFINLKKSINDPLAHGLIVGFIAGLAGLIIHSFSAATFIIIRIMEPFWTLAAIVVVLPKFLIPAKETAGN
ncbi:MAG: O-antigen ligase family protein [Candidatus Omnitrophota bacterium]